MHMHVRACTHTHTHTHIWTDTNACMQTQTCTTTLTRIHACVRALTHTHTHTHTRVHTVHTQRFCQGINKNKPKLIKSKDKQHGCWLAEWCIPRITPPVIYTYVFLQYPPPPPPPPYIAMLYCYVQLCPQLLLLFANVTVSFLSTTMFSVLCVHAWMLPCLALAELSQAFSLPWLLFWMYCSRDGKTPSTHCSMQFYNQCYGSGTFCEFKDCVYFYCWQQQSTVTVLRLLMAIVFVWLTDLLVN